MADDFLASTETTGSVPIGGTSTGNIETKGDHDWFKISVQNGISYLLDMDQAATAPLTKTDFVLRDSDGKQLFHANFDPSEPHSDLDFIATSTGTYYIDASGRDDAYTGVYTLTDTQTDDYAGSAVTAGSVSPGTPTTGIIDGAFDTDWFRVDLLSQTKYQFDITSVPLGQTHLELVDSTGKVLADDDVGTDTHNSHIDFTPTTTGSYYLVAASHWSSPENGGSNGAYTLTQTGGTAHFQVDHTQTKVQEGVAGDVYTGPVADLGFQYINITTENLNVTGGIANTFIHTGSGFDAIDVSAVGGTNVLDGGTNSNFLVGGKGASSNDTFFVDDRAATSDIWSTISNFHAGDAATIWGVTPSDFTMTWVDGQGAAGFTGVTLHATAAGKPTASITLVGYSQDDLTNGRISTSFGSIGDSNYMYIHGNS